MVNNFKFIIFSVFNVSDFILFIEIVNKIFKDETDEGKADIYSRKVVDTTYQNLVVGKIKYIPTKFFLYQTMKMDYQTYVE